VRTRPLGLWCLLTLTLFSIEAERVSKAQQTSSCPVVTQALESVAQIKTGTTRSDVEKRFTQDGGLFSRSETVYTYNGCQYIKIRVRFSLDADFKGFVSGSPKDRVVSVSTPFLEYPAKD
jgi:hypothetical protein